LLTSLSNVVRAGQVHRVTRSPSTTRPYNFHRSGDDTYGYEQTKKQESCLVEVKFFRHRSFLGRRWKNVCAMIVMLDGISCWRNC